MAGDSKRWFISKIEELGVVSIEAGMEDSLVFFAFISRALIGEIGTCACGIICSSTGTTWFSSLIHPLS